MPTNQRKFFNSQKSRKGGNRAGFQSFCSGEADVTMATNEISDEDIEACKANAVDFVELVIAYDGLILAVNE
jgi:phosphate transport system substrate-binding protein